MSEARRSEGGQVSLECSFELKGLFGTGLLHVFSQINFPKLCSRKKVELREHLKRCYKNSRFSVKLLLGGVCRAEFVENFDLDECSYFN